MERFINSVYNIVWSPPLVVLLVSAGLYFTLRTRCVQLRRFGHMLSLLKKTPDSGNGKGFSPFQAFCLALSGRVGMGNIVGVATAIALGGPGSVFWMWCIALLGASTAFMESTLAQQYKFRKGSIWRGGPFCYIEEGLGKRSLAVVFAVLVILCYGFLLTMLQSNCVALAFDNSFSIPQLATGVGMVVVLLIVFIGGVKRVARFATLVTPFMALGYILMALVIIVFHWSEVPGVFALIFKSAFGVGPVFGGMVGSAISLGVKRGLFSNEAGEGGGAIVSASADVKYPAQQGLVQAFSVYVDTLLICTATALMILVTGKYNVYDGSGAEVLSNVPELGRNYVAYTQSAIDTVFHGFGGDFVSIALIFFSFTSLIAYCFYSESSIFYILRGGKSTKVDKIMVWAFRILFFLSIIIGSCTKSDTVWRIGDIGLGLTTWVNVIVLIILCPKAIEALKDYESGLNSKRWKR